jgi:golgin subfamily A protein 1
MHFHFFAEYKKKVIQYQEDIDQLEGFQTQEMAKIKHLVGRLC